MAYAATVHELSSGWRFKETGSKEWRSVARVPTNVHLDLMAHHLIPDPFIGYNELECEWVGKTSWTYRLELPKLPTARPGEIHVLAFDGLDTFATVKLNGSVILLSDNMFIPHRVHITDRLKSNARNVVEIDFAPALLEARRIKDAHPHYKWVGSNGEMARLAVRKAQYHWGWDWGPILMTCGPWRAVKLETYSSRVADLRIDYKLDGSLRKLTGSISATIEGCSGTTVNFQAVLDDNVVFKGTADVLDGVATVEFLVQDPKLWSPHGYGSQPLYVIQATVTDGKHDLHTASRRIGFRRAELIQQPDDVGRSFYFRINGIDVFCGGSNWIPADSFTPRITPERYRRWLQTMVDGNQIMTRIWGGGIYEDNAFYDICDELGLLVWQDFMFACGNYPANIHAFRQSIKDEGVAQVKRIRHHPSLVIFAGNNEDYAIQEEFGLKYDYADKNPDHWLETDFPARYIYEKILPDVVAAHAPHVAYHPGSPWSDGKKSSDPNVGDLHQWNVWHGIQEKYQIFDTLGGRFNSEFGMEAFPHIDTIKYFVDDPTQLYPQSRMIDFHNKAAGHERRLATYLQENFRTSTDLESYIHLTQLVQSEALMFAYRGWRRQWGEKRECGGALVWQLNDCWPVTSWAIVDYFLRKKPAYYTMRRALAPVAVAVKRAHHDWSVDHARPAKTSKYECWVVSNKTAPLTARVELRFVSIQSGKDIKAPVVRDNITINANGTTDIYRGVIDNETEEPHVLAARLWIGGVLAARDTDWPQPFKYLEFPERGVSVSRKGNKIHVVAERPTKGLVFEEREGVLLKDSALDVVPGDEQIITVKGLGEDDAMLKWRYYAQ